MTGPIIKKRCLKYKIACIGLIVILLMAQVYIRPRTVKADEAVTLGEYVLTLFVSLGIGITDEKILNAVNQYLNIDINSDSATIQSAINQCQSAVGTAFITETFKSDNTSTKDYVDIVGEEYIDGFADYSATAVENISASIENYNNFGFVSIVEGGKRLAMSTPLVQLAQIAGNVAAIGWEKFTGWAGHLISSGLSLLEDDLAGYYNQGVGAYKWDPNNPGNSPYYFCTNNVDGVLVGHYEDSIGPFIWIVNNTDHAINFRNHYHRRNGSSAGSAGIAAGEYYAMRTTGVAPNGKSVWGGLYGHPDDYVGVTDNPIRSPDIITPDGNAGPGKNRPTFSHNSEKPYLRPIDIDVYMIWAGDARENTENGDTGEGQGNIFILMVEPYFVEQTDPDGIPQGNLNDPNPVYPGQPTYIPYPTADPLASPTPATEVAPAPTMTPEELDQELEDKTVRNLGNVFPFCIPFDIVNLFKKMYVPRKAPVLTWETNFGQFGTAGTITIDFSMFDSVASVCRTFELILFMLGLMIATKNLIGWGG